jgi:hypothetical protein
VIVTRCYLRCSGPCRRWLADHGHTAGFDTPGAARKAAKAQGWTIQPPADPTQRGPEDWCPTCANPKEK